jgi:hypothetical protein
MSQCIRSVWLCSYLVHIFFQCLLGGFFRFHYLKDPQWQTYADAEREPAVEDLVFVENTLDGKWRRGRVEAVCSENVRRHLFHLLSGIYPSLILQHTCSVRFVDFGNFEPRVSLSHMLPARPLFGESCPFQVSRIKYEMHIHFPLLFPRHSDVLYLKVLCLLICLTRPELSSEKRRHL